jgi:hypothetical protein
MEREVNNGAVNLSETREIIAAIKQALGDQMTERQAKYLESCAEAASLLLQFIASLTIADHLGDVAEDIRVVLDRLGIDVEWDDLSDLGTELGLLGVTTLHGTSLGNGC